MQRRLEALVSFVEVLKACPETAAALELELSKLSSVLIFAAEHGLLQETTVMGRLLDALSSSA